jgi:hypothetical protein
LYDLYCILAEIVDSCHSNSPALGSATGLVQPLPIANCVSETCNCLSDNSLLGHKHDYRVEDVPQETKDTIETVRDSLALRYRLQSTAAIYTSEVYVEEQGHSDMLGQDSATTAVFEHLETRLNLPFDDCNFCMIMCALENKAPVGQNVLKFIRQRVATVGVSKRAC